MNPVAADVNACSTAYSPMHIRATWGGTSSVADASNAFGFSRAKGYDLVRQGKFPCRVLHIGRGARVVTASCSAYSTAENPSTTTHNLMHPRPNACGRPPQPGRVPARSWRQPPADPPA